MLDNPGLYVHFPWCVRKCPYCDFNSHPLKQDTDRAAYVEALCLDLMQQLEQWRPAPFASVFLGGGTPSLFDPQQLEPVMRNIPTAQGAEITMEANPGTTEHADFAGYAALGVNRLSVGAQSFDDQQLLGLGRIHSADETRAAIDQARAGGFTNINIDLMWGLPGQNVAGALADLDAAIALGPEHISWYQLTIEPRTEFARRPPQLPIEDALYDMERAGLARLADAGFERYEISAFAKPGHRCRHNLNYWQFGDYLGIGAGAHGKASSAATGTTVRTSKPRQPRLYQIEPDAIEQNTIARAELPVEFMLNALRLVHGVEFARFSESTGIDWLEQQAHWHTLIEKGLARDDRCGLTALGLRYLDSVVQTFLDR